MLKTNSREERASQKETAEGEYTIYMVYKKDLYVLEKLAETKVAESL